MTGQAPAAFAPRHVVVVDALPLLPAGKPDRLALERLATAAVGQDCGRPSAR